MNLPAIITNLFAATESRRRDQLAALEAKAVQLQADYEAAIAAGDDAKADGIAGKLLRTQAEAGAARMAIETAQRQASAREADAARVEQERHAQEYAQAWASYEREAVRFEELVTGEVLAQWRLVESQFEAARFAATAAGIARGSETPGRAWNLVFTRFLQATQERGKAPMAMPMGRSASRALESLAERFARKEQEPRAVAEQQSFQGSEA